MTAEKIGLAQELAFVNGGYQANLIGMSIPGRAPFTCKDIGIDCPFEAFAKNDHELMRKVIVHTETAHSMPFLSADVILKVKNAMKKQ